MSEGALDSSLYFAVQVVKIMWLKNRIKSYLSLIHSMNDRLDKIQQALGRIEGRQLQSAHSRQLADMEFQVYSQWGEDGIIQSLLNHVSIENKTFVEFGVQDYTESNTRFLLVNNNWSGLVIDGSDQNIESIKKDSIYWKYNLKAECAFITKENINNLLEKNGIVGEVGLLSIDIDGNDYWVWERISCIQPRIVICEYNSLFGPSAKVSTPYDPAFTRNSAHYSNLYYGASLAALEYLGNRKGYSLVGANAAGNNAFFVRSDVLGDLKSHTSAQLYVRSQFREGRSQDGNLTYQGFDDRLVNIKDLPVVDVINGRELKLMDAIAAP